MLNQYRLYCDFKRQSLTVFLIHFMGGVNIFLLSFLTSRFGRKWFLVLGGILGLIGLIMVSVPSVYYVSAIGIGNDLFIGRLLVFRSFECVDLYVYVYIDVKLVCSLKLFHCRISEMDC